MFENWEVKKLAWQWTLYNVLFATLKMIAPYLPHITEEIYQNQFKDFANEISIHKCAFPTEILNIDNPEKITSEFEKVSEVIEAVRRFKTESQISMWTALEKIVVYCSDEDRKNIELFEDDVLWVTKADSIEWKAWDLTVDCVVKPEEKAE